MPKYNPVGTTFLEGDVTLKVMEIKNPSACYGCWYANRKNYNKGCSIHQHGCTPGTRKDGKQVIFVNVAELEEKMKLRKIRLKE